MAVTMAYVALYAGLALGVGWLWKRKGLGFAAGFLWSVLLSPVLGGVIGLLLNPDTAGDAEGGKGRRRRRWILPAAILFAAVVALIVSVVLVPVHEFDRRGRAHVDTRRIADGVEAFREARGRYPTTAEGLSLLIQEGFLRYNAPDRTLRDPWNRPYLYEWSGRVHPDRFDVKSYGEDGQPGGDGENADICNE